MTTVNNLTVLNKLFSPPTFLHHCPPPPSPQKKNKEKKKDKENKHYPRNEKEKS